MNIQTVSIFVYWGKLTLISRIDVSRSQRTLVKFDVDKVVVDRWVNKFAGRVTYLVRRKYQESLIIREDETNCRFSTSYMYIVAWMKFCIFQ